ncbi:MAG: ABA4-like family protein [Marinoscillum sp.]
MEASRIFELVNFIALIAWALMIFTPKWKYTTKMVKNLISPVLLSMAYLTIISTTINGSSLDITSLDQVRKLFNNDYVLLAGWIHYLAFDLFVGCWILKKSLDEKIPLYVSIPCLLFTFIAGPIGCLLFVAAYYIKKKTWISL